MIPVTPETVKAVYVMLKAFPPFNKWSLPAANQITFATAPLTGRRGDWDPNTHTLRVSTVCITTYLGLVGVVAHEICHLRQQIIDRAPEANGGHNKEFHRMAAQICKQFPFLDAGHF